MCHEHSAEDDNRDVTWRDGAAALDPQRVTIEEERPQALPRGGHPQGGAGRQRPEQRLVGEVIQSAASTYLTPAGVMRGPRDVRFTLPGCVRNAFATFGAAYFTPCFAQNFDVVPLETSMPSPAT